MATVCAIEAMGFCFEAGRMKILFRATSLETLRNMKVAAGSGITLLSALAVLRRA